ncbi:reverse transcriptase domain-containing protein [Tanacetum coccineum]
MSTSEASAMTQAAIKKLVADSVNAALEAQGANMANTDNTTRPREAPVARQCSYKEFMSCQPINFKGSEGAIGVIRWFERTESVFSQSNCTEDYKKQRPATGSNLLPVTVTCHACGERGHYANQCRKTTNNNAQGIAYMLRDRNAHQDPNVVTGMYLLNQYLARVLFDFGADKSFVSISLASKLNIPPITIDTFYNIEMVDGNLVSTNTIIQGETLTLLNQPFEIDLMPIKLGNFDVVIGLHVDPVKIKAVKNWAYPTTPTEIRQFLGLIGYYQRFITDLSNIAKSLTELTQKNKKYIWGKDQETAFQLLKQKLCEAPILALP